jgi:hypothetical protein
MKNLVFWIISLGSVCLGQMSDKSVFPDELLQRIAEVKSSTRVLLVAAEPGMEDQALAVYLRTSVGASLSTLFLTNGESLEPDDGQLLPHLLAAQRRLEASKVMSRLGAESYFLNLPDPGSVHSVSALRLQWPSDTVQAKLARFISRLRPDAVILCDDTRERGKSVILSAIENDLVESARLLKGGKNAKSGIALNESQLWNIRLVLVEDQSAQGIKLSLDKKAPSSGRSFFEVGNDLRSMYESVRKQTETWDRGKSRSFRVLLPRSLTATSLDRIITKNVTPRVSKLSNEIDAWCASYLSQRKKGSGGQAKPFLRSLKTLIERVDTTIKTWFGFDQNEKALVLQWKNGLEALRNSLLGLDLKFSISDTVVADRQLTFLTIDTLIGRSATGRTQVYFPATVEGWVVDESLESRLPYRTKDPYRLLSPQQLTYNLPISEYGLDDLTVGRPFPFLIVHKDTVSPELSFNLRTVATFFYSPRFTTEVLIPAVRVAPEEFTVVRLTNHSRDGVRDSVHVSDSLVVSQKSPFRLSVKESTEVDTLFLTWRKNLPDDTYLIPIMIGKVRVTQFGARSFHCDVDTTKRVAFIAGALNSPLKSALRRIGIRARELSAETAVKEGPGNGDVVIVDRRALTFHPELAGAKSPLEKFASSGGHVIILAQDADRWQSSPLLEGISLKRANELSASLSVSADSSDKLLSAPNVLGPSDWSDWLFRLGSNEVSIAKQSGIRGVISISTPKKQYPQVATMKFGSGRMTYVDLNLWHQWMNVHPGAHRLLANLISY